MGWLADETGLDKQPANHLPLTPLSHLDRALALYPQRTALVYGPIRRTYAEYHARCTQLAAALAARGIKPGDVVATILPNLPAQVEAHWGVPACGAVLNTINTRLDPATVRYIFEHGGAKIVLCDTAFLGLAEVAIAEMAGPPPEIIEVPDPIAGLAASGRYPAYEDMLAEGDPDFFMDASRVYLTMKSEGDANFNLKHLTQYDVI